MWVVELAGLRRSLADAVSAALFAHGATGTQEDWLPGTAPAPLQPWEADEVQVLPDRILLRAWFETPDRQGVLETVRRWLDTETTLAWREEPEVDWEAHTHAAFPAIQVGTLRISPPWEAQPGDLIIEPGSGFGTGDHPTTRQALLLFQGLQHAPARCLDLGCGSGILALAAAQRGWDVTGIDIEEPALSNARHNAGLNGLTATFANVDSTTLAPAPLVFANLHAELLVQFADELHRLTQKHLIMAGILADREHKVLAMLQLPIVERIVDGEWVALRVER